MENEICFSKINEKDTALIREYFYRTFTLYNGYVLHDEFSEKVHCILNMNIRDDDVWVCSFPKAGTTWTQEMVWCIANDLNFSKAKIPLPQRYIFLDVSFLIPTSSVNANQSLKNKLWEMLSKTESAKQENSRRFIKTHLPYDFLPRKLKDGSTKAKIICVARNPRDTCISSFHHQVLLGRYKGDLEQYSKIFIKDLVSFGPYWKHVLSYWKKREDENLLFIKFEDMKKDLPSVIRKTATFLEKSVDEDAMDELCQHLSFESMKKNSSVNGESWTEMVRKMSNPSGNGSFFRTGGLDQWKKDLKPETIDRFGEWEIKNLKDVGLECYSSL